MYQQVDPRAFEGTIRWLPVVQSLREEILSSLIIKLYIAKQVVFRLRMGGAIKETVWLLLNFH